KTTCAAMFLPDTYQFYWNTSEEKFIEKIYSYYKQFWTENRLKKASQINLSPIEVSILASIVQKEQAQFKDEQPIIAALYLNRLKIGMPLQSCPTLIFAIGDYSIKRVTSKMLALDSPFNTYKHTGLPPSPICFPEKGAIDAVLNPDNNDYIFMCAKSDFSGRHNFSKSYEDQKRFARDYQKALDRIGIHNEH
ncbi:MAG: endolytic transglycosylase MltG, partial [Bacteroidales bacterium]|nr:endolytic transglycosylase MltG [Bacteroidales bacterium]